MQGKEGENLKKTRWNETREGDRTENGCGDRRAAETGVTQKDETWKHLQHRIDAAWKRPVFFSLFICFLLFFLIYMFSRFFGFVFVFFKIYLCIKILFQYFFFVLIGVDAF